MVTSRQNQARLQHQQLEQSNGGLLLKNIFSIYASHPWLSLLFVIIFALFTNSLFALLGCMFGEASFPLDTIIWINGFLLAFLVLIFLVVWRLHYGSIKPKDITQKRVLITLVSAHKTSIKDTPSYEVLDALLYNGSRQPTQNLLEEVVLVATEDASTKAMADKLKAHVETLGRTGRVKTVVVTDKYPDGIKRQFAIILKDVMVKYSAGDIICDYTGGTKNMSIALYALARGNFVTAVYLYDAMNERSAS